MGTFVAPMGSAAVAKPAAKRCAGRHADPEREARVNIVEDVVEDVDDVGGGKVKTANLKSASAFNLFVHNSDEEADHRSQSHVFSYPASDHSAFTPSSMPSHPVLHACLSSYQVADTVNSNHDSVLLHQFNIRMRTTFHL